MNISKLGQKCRKYAEEEQNREFGLEGACHENAIGCAEYIQYHTEYTPIIVWGYVGDSPNDEDPNSLEETEESGQTHFWVKIKETGQIIDIHPIDRSWSDSNLPTNSSYAGSLPHEYVSVKEFHYEGWMTSADLASKMNFDLISDRIREF